MTTLTEERVTKERVTLEEFKTKVATTARQAKTGHEVKSQLTELYNIAHDYPILASPRAKRMITHLVMNADALPAYNVYLVLDLIYSTL